MFGRRNTRRRVKRRQPHVPLSAGFLFEDDAPTAPLPVIPTVPNESYYMPGQTSELPPSYPTDPNSPAPYAGPDWITDVVPCPAAEKLAKAWPARARAGLSCGSVSTRARTAARARVFGIPSRQMAFRGLLRRRLIEGEKVAWTRCYWSCVLRLALFYVRCRCIGNGGCGFFATSSR